MSPNDKRPLLKYKGRLFDSSNIENVLIQRVIKERFRHFGEFLFGYNDDHTDHTEEPAKRRHSDYKDYNDRHHTDHVDRHVDKNTGSHTDKSTNEFYMTHSWEGHVDRWDGHSDFHTDGPKRR